jgi:homoserine kinase
MRKRHLIGDVTSESVQFAIRESMKDRIHQPYRSKLVPGLSECIQLTMPGLLGVCLSGAGPSICALAIENFDEIGQTIKNVLKEKKIDSEHFVLNIIKTD